MLAILGTQLFTPTPPPPPPNPKKKKISVPLNCICISVRSHKTFLYKYTCYPMALKILRLHFSNKIVMHQKWFFFWLLISISNTEQNLKITKDYTFFAAASASVHTSSTCLYSCSVFCFVLHSPFHHLRPSIEVSSKPWHTRVCLSLLINNSEI